MDIKKKINIAKAILKARFLSYKIPLMVSWHLVNRCNRRCKYCYRWNTEIEELTTEETLQIINQLAESGTQAIIFSGGEPLLRTDIIDIIHYCQMKKIFVGLTSNGDLVAEKIKEIKNLNMLKLSLDGPEEIHDFLRGEGSYGNVMNAVKIAKENNMNVKFNTTLTRYNIDSLSFILQKAKALDVKVKFQPVSHVHSAGVDITSLYPEEKKYKQAIQELIYLKKVNPHIINSVAALKYLYHWPFVKKLRCYAGSLICCIAPNGDIYPCSAMRDKVESLNCLSSRFKEIFYNLTSISSCNGCWCTSTLELNCLLTFNIETILNIRKLFAWHN